MSDEKTVKREPVDFDFTALNWDFIKQLAQIPPYAAEKYGSWEQYRDARLRGEKSPLNHIFEHARMYMMGEPYEKFDAHLGRHLVAIAYNAMMEWYYLHRWGHEMHALSLQSPPTVLPPTPAAVRAAAFEVPLAVGKPMDAVTCDFAVETRFAGGNGKTFAGIDRCGAAGVTSVGGRWFCCEHEVEGVQEEARRAKRAERATEAQKRAPIAPPIEEVPSIPDEGYEEVPAEMPKCGFVLAVTSLGTSHCLAPAPRWSTIHNKKLCEKHAEVFRGHGERLFDAEKGESPMPSFSPQPSGTSTAFRRAADEEKNNA
jgi:hypothetical protein